MIFLYKYKSLYINKNQKKNIEEDNEEDNINKK